MKKFKTFLYLTLLLASSVVMATDTPFQAGKYYKTGAGFNNMTFKVEAVKGSWVLVSDLPNSPVEICGSSKTPKGCWINTNTLPYVQETKVQ